MTTDTELEEWRGQWQAQRLTVPDVHPADAAPAQAEFLPHAEFLDAAIRRLRFRFWKWPERNFLAALRRQLKDEDVQAHGRRMRRRGKVKGGLNV